MVHGWIIWFFPFMIKAIHTLIRLFPPSLIQILLFHDVDHVGGETTRCWDHVSTFRFTSNPLRGCVPLCLCISDESLVTASFVLSRFSGGLWFLTYCWYFQHMGQFSMFCGRWISFVLLVLVFYDCLYNPKNMLVFVRFTNWIDLCVVVFSI